MPAIAADHLRLPPPPRYTPRHDADLLPPCLPARHAVITLDTAAAA